MQVVILCGGSGTRLREETEFKPKPMIHVGGKPLLWHIMKLYSYWGHNEFVLALGYKQEMIKEYFYNFDLINHDYRTKTGEPRIIKSYKMTDQWDVILADTGETTLKGSRLKRVEKYITGDTFMMTYGDGVANVNIQALIDFHYSHGKIATVTGVHPAPRFGEILHKDGEVISFSEKPYNGENLVSGGFFVFNRKIFDYLHVEEWCDLEVGPLELLAQQKELMVYHHKGYFGCMDTVSDMYLLNELWNKGEAKWKVWD